MGRKKKAGQTDFFSTIGTHCCNIDFLKEQPRGPTPRYQPPFHPPCFPDLRRKETKLFFWSPAYQQATKQKHVDKHPILLPSHPDYSTYYPPFPPKPKFLTITNHPEKRKKANSSFFRGGQGGGNGEGRSKHKRVAKKKASLRFLLLL